MDQFYLDPRKIHAILLSKGISHLFHANTVRTALSFIDAKSLLSRAYIEKNNLVQTPQKSDAEDKNFGVWDDIFLDGVDLHNKYNRANLYGPIVFALKLDMLNAPGFPNILVTKNNPMFWKEGEPWSDRYCSQSDEVKTNYLTGKIIDARMMFTIRSPDLRMKLNKYLDHMVIDDPNIILSFNDKSTLNIGEKTQSVVAQRMEDSGLGHIPIKLRHKEKTHSAFCKCFFNYNILAKFRKDEFKNRFRTTDPV